MKRKFTICHTRMVEERSWWEIEADSVEEALENYDTDGECVDTEMGYEYSNDGSSVVVEIEEIKK